MQRDGPVSRCAHCDEPRCPGSGTPSACVAMSRVPARASARGQRCVRGSPTPIGAHPGEMSVASPLDVSRRRHGSMVALPGASDIRSNTSSAFGSMSSRAAAAGDGIAASGTGQPMRHGAVRPAKTRASGSSGGSRGACPSGILPCRPRAERPCLPRAETSVRSGATRLLVVPGGDLSMLAVSAVPPAHIVCSPRGFSAGT